MVDEKIKHAIHNCIKTYDLTSKSKKFSKLTFRNEGKIIKSINAKEKDKFYDLLSKRDYYTTKLYKLLNDSITSEVTENETEITHNRIINGPDPKFMTNRYLARKYVESQILPDDYKRQAIKSLILKHFAFQRSSKESREEIIKKFEESVKMMKPNAKLSKLASTNAHIKDHAINNKKIDLDNELNSLNDKIVFSQKNYSKEACESLQDLKVPFFCTDEEYKYPQLDGDRKYVLDLLVELLAGKENKETPR